MELIRYFVSKLIASIDLLFWFLFQYYIDWWSKHYYLL